MRNSQGFPTFPGYNRLLPWEHGSRLNREGESMRQGFGGGTNIRAFGRISTLRLPAVALLGAWLLGASASATTFTFEANLDGLQVVPPNASPAFGLAQLTLDDTSGLVTITTGTYQDLLGGASSVSLNGLAAPGANAAVIFALTLDTPGAATGTFSGGGTLTAPQIAGMEAEDTYILIRSSVFPSGEIRGQLLAVPEPSSIVLTSMGLIGFVFLKRRRN